MYDSNGNGASPEIGFRCPRLRLVHSNAEDEMCSMCTKSVWWYLGFNGLQRTKSILLQHSIMFVLAETASLEKLVLNDLCGESLWWAGRDLNPRPSPCEGDVRSGHHGLPGWTTGPNPAA